MALVNLSHLSCLFVLFFVEVLFFIIEVYLLLHLFITRLPLGWASTRLTCGL
jgi:hypothetical protein